MRWPRPHSALLLVGLVVLLAAAPSAAVAKDGGDDSNGDRREARVSAHCGSGVRGELRLRAEHGAIRVEFRLRSRPRATWRLAIVQEHRVMWRGTARSGSRGSSVEVRRTIPDLAGVNEVTVRASGPRGVTCDARAVLTAHN